MEDSHTKNLNTENSHEGGLSANARYVVTLQNIKKSFRGGRDQILKGIHLNFVQGQLTYVLGASGTGKSVTLKHILGLLQPDSGTVTAFGKDLSLLTASELTQLREKFGMVFQYAALFDDLTVFENVAFPLYEHTDLSPEEIEKQVVETLQSLGMKGPYDKYPNEISGGMRKRVGIARAIIRKPEVLLYDEPTTGLDPATRKTVDELIEKINREFKLTSIVISHDVPAALRLADHIVFLDGGYVVFEGTPQEFVQSKHERIRAFLEADRTSYEVFKKYDVAHS